MDDEHDDYIKTLQWVPKTMRGPIQTQEERGLKPI